ncbi:alpha-N-arabinofuranosidase A [Colletotrichum lupini]|uniref:Alpha-N-arabinofuranosidase A n=1 Tax=Colletotrichum lupini TaxID=145971 RepID=A0A9Q8WPG8_9PEZI|nr:alpha-N-arabinofuranosidase A [Colletotrichum lupini]UQC90382.1 alpha-N-arabinofuranosidase A [Colletotrichum lupini]
MGRWDVQWSDMKGSVSEAIFMLGLERNSDLIRDVAFAPLISLVDHQQWAPNLNPFKQAPDARVYTSNYWVQQLFAQNAGSMTHEIISDTRFDSVFWSAHLDIEIAGKRFVTLSILGHDNPDSANTHDAAPISLPVVFYIESSDGNFSFLLPVWSVAVLRTD